MDLVSRTCAPCKGTDPKLTAAQVGGLLEQIRGWSAKDEKLCKTFKFKDFVTAMSFLNRVADVAEKEQHHPDFCVHYNQVDFSIFTHTVGGLSENDFILAAKIDALA